MLLVIKIVQNMERGLTAQISDLDEPQRIIPSVNLHPGASPNWLALATEYASSFRLPTAPYNIHVGHNGTSAIVTPVSPPHAPKAAFAIPTGPQP